MEPVLLLLLAATGLLLVWLLAEALFYNALVEFENAREWLGELRAGIRHGAYARASDRKKRTMAYIYERQAAATRRKFQDWLDRELGTPERANAIDRDVLEAQQQTPVLLKLAQELLPKTIERCVAFHRLAAMAEGVNFVYEIALEPECFTLRERVNFLNAEIVERLERYPFLTEDPVLWQNLIVIRSRIGPICRNCPYLGYDVNRAAREICPSAELVKSREEAAKGNDQDRENAK